MGKNSRFRKIFKYSRAELTRVYEKIVRYSQYYYKKNDLAKCLRYIDGAALLQYSLNDRYSDERLDNLLKDISFQRYKQTVYKVANKTVCFIDSYARDNHGLTQQYLDAIISCGCHIVYISEKTGIGPEILRMLHNSKAQIVITDTNNVLNISDIIYDAVLQSRPAVTFFHLAPNSIASIIALNSINGTEKVQINLTDHAFWLGGHTFFDKLFEFRPYGKTVSLEKRRFKQEQIVMMPFYPWTTGAPFDGFPIETEGKVVMFSGGAIYKTEGGGDKYFSMLRRILDNHPQVVFFYAGDGNSSHFESFIKEYGYEDRVYLLGQRNDINEVFKHSDIYYSTYPLPGGLMSQYAAINGIPILALKDKELESVVCNKKIAKFTFESEDALIEEARLLIEKPEYRKDRGAFFRKLCMNKMEFRHKFGKWMEDKNSSTADLRSFVDYDAFCEQYILRINNGSQKLTIELMLLRRCPRALNWKMWLNILLNIPEVIRVQRTRREIN